MIFFALSSSSRSYIISLWNLFWVITIFIWMQQDQLPKIRFPKTLNYLNTTTRIILLTAAWQSISDIQIVPENKQFEPMSEMFLQPTWWCHHHSESPHSMENTWVTNDICKLLQFAFFPAFNYCDPLSRAAIKRCRVRDFPWLLWMWSPATFIGK